MLLSKVFPEIHYSEEPDYEVFSFDTGGVIAFNPFDATSDDGVGPHSGHERVAVPPVDLTQYVEHAAFTVEKQWMRRADPPVIPDREKDDQAPISHQTGDARRFFVMISAEKAAMGDIRGWNAIRTWNREQLRRPMSHRPWDAKCDAYSCAFRSGFEYDTVVAGYNAMDPAHLSSAMQFAGALARDPMAVVNLWMLGRFDYHVTPPGKSFWLGQPRGRGWKLVLWTQMHLAGFATMDVSLRDTYFGGKAPRKLLEAYVRQLLDFTKAEGEHYWGSNNLDSRVMPILNGGNPHPLTGAKELEGGYGWQAWLDVWGRVYTLKSGVIQDQALRAELLEDTVRLTRELIERCAGDGGSSYAQSARSYDLAVGEALLAEARVKDPTLELRQLASGKVVLRTPPRKDDLWLAAAAPHVLGVEEFRRLCPEWERLMPKPGHKDYYDNASKSKATYLEPFWRAIEDEVGPLK